MQSMNCRAVKRRLQKPRAKASFSGSVSADSYSARAYWREFLDALRPESPYCVTAFANCRFSISHIAVPEPLRWLERDVVMGVIRLRS